jgi:hypothetical protein
MRHKHFSGKPLATFVTDLQRFSKLIFPLMTVETPASNEVTPLPCEDLLHGYAGSGVSLVMSPIAGFHCCEEQAVFRSRLD